MKVCSCCLKQKPEHSYYYNLSGKDGHFTKCKSCCRRYQHYRKQKQKENAPPKLKQKIFYSPTTPPPFDPKHTVTIEHTLVKMTFD